MRKKKRNRSFRIVSENKRIWANEELRRKCLTAENLAVQITTDEIISCEISHDTVTRFLNAEVNINKDKFTAIAKKLGKSPEWFLEPGQTTTAPRRAVKHFSGKERNVLLEELKKNLAAPDNTTAYSLTGRSGIGKTEQILKLIEKDTRLEKPIFNGGYCFINVGMGLIESQIETFFKKFKKNNPACPSPPDELKGKERVQGWYNLFPLFDSKILIVFDNVRYLEQIADYLPSESMTMFQVVATTQNINLCRRFKNIAIKDLDDNDAEDIIRSVINNDSFVEERKSDLLRICTLVGNLPLAIDTIVHYIRRLRKIRPNIVKIVRSQLETDSQVAQVVCKFPSDMEYVLDRLSNDLRIKLQNEGLRAVYGIIWEAYDSNTRKIAHSLASFAPGEISYSLIRDCFPEYEDETFDSILSDNLVGQSFVDVNEEEVGVFRLHELTRTFVRESLFKSSGADNIYEKVAHSLEKHIITRENNSPTINNLSLTFHVDYYLQEVSRNSLVSPKATDEQLAHFYCFTKQFYLINRFTDRLDRCLKEYGKFIESDDVGKLFVLSDRATVLYYQGLSDEALQKAQMVIDRAEEQFHLIVPQERHLKVDDPNYLLKVMRVSKVIINANFLATDIYIRNENLEKARKHLTKASLRCNFIIKVLPKSDAVYKAETILMRADLCFREGQILRLEKQAKKALLSMRKARSFLDEVLKLPGNSDFQNHYKSEAATSLASVLTEIICLLIDIGQKHDASATLKRYEKLIKKWNIKMTRSAGMQYRNIGVTFGRKGLFKDALSSLDKALKSFSSAQGDHSETIADIHEDIKLINLLNASVSFKIKR